VSTGERSRHEQVVRALVPAISPEGDRTIPVLRRGKVVSVQSTTLTLLLGGTTLTGVPWLATAPVANDGVWVLAANGAVLVLGTASNDR